MYSTEVREGLEDDPKAGSEEPWLVQVSSVES